MSAEQIPGGPEPSNSEQQEWPGQKWEYLVLESASTGKYISPIGTIKPKGLLSSEDVDPISKHYKNKIENLRNEIGGDSRRETLNLFGTDGWELIAVVPNTTGGSTGSLLLFLKRPFRNQE